MKTSVYQNLLIEIVYYPHEDIVTESNVIYQDGNAFDVDGWYI